MNPFARLRLFSHSSLAVITSSVMMSFLTVAVAKAEPQPPCFMIDASGEVVNLADICNVKPQGQIKSNSIIPIPTINATNRSPRLRVSVSPRQLSVANLHRNGIRQIKNAINSDFTTENTEIRDRPAELVYFVGNGSVPFALGTSSAAYYSGGRFTYVRRYREAQRFSTRNNARDAFLESQVKTQSVRISGRTPFIIYRYQK